MRLSWPLLVLLACGSGCSLFSDEKRSQPLAFSESAQRLCDAELAIEHALGDQPKAEHCGQVSSYQSAYKQSSDLRNHQRDLAKTRTRIYLTKLRLEQVEDQIRRRETELVADLTPMEKVAEQQQLNELREKAGKLGAQLMRLNSRASEQQQSLSGLRAATEE